MDSIITDGGSKVMQIIQKNDEQKELMDNIKGMLTRSCRWMSNWNHINIEQYHAFVLETSRIIKLYNRMIIKIFNYCNYKITLEIRGTSKNSLLFNY